MEPYHQNGHEQPEHTPRLPSPPNLRPSSPPVPVEAPSPSSEDTNVTALNNEPPPTRPPLATFAPRLSTVPSNASRPTSLQTEDGRQIQRVPSIRLRRLRHIAAPSPLGASQATSAGLVDDGSHGRPRSVSEPRRNNWGTGAFAPPPHATDRAPIPLPRLTEEGRRPSLSELGHTLSSNSFPITHRPQGQEDNAQAGTNAQEPIRKLRGARTLSKLFHPGQNAAVQGPSKAPAGGRDVEEYDARLVDWLDVFDPEIQTLSTLTNVQNSLFVPDLGGLINRRPTYILSDYERGLQAKGARRQGQEPVAEEEEQGPEAGQRPAVERVSSISSRLTDSHYAALPHGTTLDGWTEEEKMELEDRVRHMLHSRRSRFKRGLKGFGQYVRTPLGFFVTLYAVLITLFGLAWVLFLIGWIYVGDEQLYAIHVIDSVLVALFAIVGDGMAPLRAIDTYHLVYVVRYSRIVKKKNKRQDPETEAIAQPLEQGAERTSEQGGAMVQAQKSMSNLPQNPDSPPTMIPPPQDDPQDDLESGKISEGGNMDYEREALALSPKQLHSLCHHQKKLSKSHSFYKSQETSTHYAFPLSYLVAIVILLDFHSCLQISLGACTWGIDYRTRPMAITTTILCVSITCNITAGLLISIGDRKTRKKDVVALLDRQELTAAAIKRVKKGKKSDS